MPGRYDAPMAETAQAKSRKLGKAHWFVLIVWAALLSWLLYSMIASVAGALFFGEGPLNPPPTQEVVLEAPATPEAPTP